MSTKHTTKVNNRSNTSRSEITVDEMAARIATAIHEHRLLPGTKLGEDRLANIFNTSRARVREVLARMARDQMVELFPQRGAFVAKPSIEQALDVFEARRLIEPGIVRRLVLNMDNSKIRRLQTHLKQERDARANSDKRATVRLSGEFHVLLAELAGNSALLRSMRELSTLTCLTISLYESAVNTCCLVDEHEAVVDAIVAGNGELAEQLMLSHLDHIQGSLRLEADADDADLEQILGDL
ncbi:GntR family transcriptional regulator [Comamonas thiooxydans]|uniref:GntR family transcriptional regulator n=2 Tax=Comamonadaceae TaxID=80864 RepID=A0A0E3BW26_9BURK|nr:GntR family transcriptional regulator [Comamonas thiooxydans]KGH22733.1 GntR family transcriptional regulator [Comamonas thiooxydans]KGH24313.1 GntR family transcriptional regulator [Comamonas thiooxydans]